MENLSPLATRAPQLSQNLTPLDIREAEAMRLRAKIVGVLIQQSRKAASRSVEDCARRLQVLPELVTDWEYGDDVPSLPQLELLASYLNVPVSMFWQENEPREFQEEVAENDQFVALRQRLLGGLLRAARDPMGITIEQLSELTAIDKSLLREYEYGEQVIPMNHLLVLANSLDRDLEYFLENEHNLDAGIEPENASSAAMANTDEQRRFADDQKTQGLIKLAVAFSQIPSEELHRIADALIALSRAKSGSNGA